MNEGGEGTDCLLTSQWDASEAFDLVEEAFDEMALLVEMLVERMLEGAGWVRGDLRAVAEIIADEITQRVGVIGGVCDDMLDASHACEQGARLRTIAPLTGRDRHAQRGAESIDGGVDL